MRSGRRPRRSQRSRRDGRVLLFVLPLILVLAGGAGAYLFLRRAPKQPPAESVYELTLADLLINLADQDSPHYLSLSLTFWIAGESPEEAVQEREAPIRDAILMAVSQHTYHDLLSTEGKQALKDDLSAAVGELLAGDKLTVQEVLFTDFVME